MTDITIANLVTGVRGETFVPLGPLYLTSVLQRAGYSSTFLDYQLEESEDKFSRESVLRFLDVESPLLGVSCYYSLLPRVLLAARELKVADPERKIVLGGPGPTPVHEEIIRNFPWIDAVVRGEGEVTVVEMMQRMGKGLHGVEGITFRDRDGDIHVNPPRPRIRDLDGLPFPDYGGIDLRRYSRVGVMTQRGCTMQCTFCEVAPLWGNLNRARTVNNTIEEIRVLHEEHGVRSIRINDDLFTLNRRRVVEFCDALAAEHLEVQWACLARVDLMNEDLMGKMQASGCEGVQYGLESGSNVVLSRIRKGFASSEGERVVLASLKHFPVVCTFIWGFPFETMEQFYETVSLASRLAQAGAEIQLILLAPAPLSRIYAEYRNGIAFSAELCADSPWQVDAKFAEREDAIRLVEAHPDIFPDFYYFESETLQTKLAVLKEAGLWGKGSSGSRSIVEVTDGPRPLST